MSDPKDEISASLGSPWLRGNFSSEIESSSGDKEFSLLLSVGKTSLMRELEMRHPQTNVPQETGALFCTEWSSAEK